MTVVRCRGCRRVTLAWRLPYCQGCMSEIESALYAAKPTSATKAVASGVLFVALGAPT